MTKNGIAVGDRDERERPSELRERTLIVAGRGGMSQTWRRWQWRGRRASLKRALLILWPTMKRAQIRCEFYFVH